MFYQKWNVFSPVQDKGSPLIQVQCDALQILCNLLYYIYIEVYFCTCSSICTVCTRCIRKQMRLLLYRRPHVCERLDDLILYLALCMTDKSCKDNCFLRICLFALAWLVGSLPPPPLPETTINGVRNFVAGLTRHEKSFDEMKKTTQLAFGDKSLHKSTIYRIISKE